jgi:sugar lactone lactonase YvrE
VAFLNGELYAVTAGGGCGHGNPHQPNMVAMVDTVTGHWTMIADMSAAVAAHPAANVDDDDFQPDGDFYSLIAARGKLYTVEPNHGQVWSVTTKGEVEMVTDVSKPQGHIVPTAVADSDGGLLLSNLGVFPITPDSSQLLTLRPGCGAGIGFAVEDCGPGKLHLSAAATPGLTTVVSMAWGPDGLLYVLEVSDPQTTTEMPPYFPTPGDGKVVRVRNSVAEDVITGLSVPTGMTFGPDGALYVSNWGAAEAPIGQILRFNVH